MFKHIFNVISFMCLVLFNSTSAHAMTIKQAQAHINKEFPGHRILSKGQFAPQYYKGELDKSTNHQAFVLADFNLDGHQDFAVLAYDPASKPVPYRDHEGWIIICHLYPKPNKGKCHKVEQINIHLPFEEYFRVYEGVPSSCSGEFSDDAPVLYLQPILGNWSRIYYYEKNQYKRCSHGD